MRLFDRITGSMSTAGLQVLSVELMKLPGPRTHVQFLLDTALD